MERELLLESNQIHFEPLHNIRQMVSKLFSSSEEPLLDDNSSGSIDTNNMTVPIDSLIHNGAEKIDDSWRDVNKIFETINKQMVRSHSTSQYLRQNIINGNEDGHRLNSLIPSQSNKHHYAKSSGSRKVTTTLDSVQIDQKEVHGETDANKENVTGVRDRKAADAVASRTADCAKQRSKIESEPNQTRNGNMASSQSTTLVPCDFSNSKQDQFLNEQSNRVRQVNVEMFTITLKRDPAKDKS